MQFIRFAVVGFGLLTGLYWLVSIYSLSVRRERLEDAWEALEKAEQAQTSRDRFVMEGLERYQNGFRRKLILLVYVIPTLAVAVLIYVIN